MKRLLLFTVIVAAVTLGGLWSGKKFCTMMSLPVGGRPGQAVYSELGLDAAQTESVRKLEASFRKDADALCMRICEERVKLLREIKDKRLGEDALYRKVDEIGKLQVSLEKKVIAHMLQVDKRLSPSQSQAYLERIYRQQCQMISQSGYGEILEKGSDDGAK